MYTLPILTGKLDGGRFLERIEEAGHEHLLRGPITTLQVNVGKLCNQACHHCHVDAGPNRREVMTAATAERVLELLEASPAVETLDITGGAPELNPSFERLVTTAARLARKVIVRCNLTVLFEPGMEGLPALYRDHGVQVIASLPCYLAENVERQRGRGVFGKSIDALRLLNEQGYAKPGTGLELHLVYNPLGAQLPPPQRVLEEAYRTELRARYGVAFDRLLTITNMPISRFADQLARQGKTEEYLRLLVDHFNPATLPQLMCRSLVSVSWDGRIYDCDFNQMLDLPAENPDSPDGAGAPTVWDVADLAQLHGGRIRTADHCLGCAAGSGSSCGGALA